MDEPWEINIEMRLHPEVAKRLAGLVENDPQFGVLFVALEAAVESHETTGRPGSALVLLPVLPHRLSELF